MTSIRPNVWPPVPASAKPAQAVDSAARMGAQKAFFEALKAAAPTAKVSDSGTGGQTASAPRIPRPGSLLDIWV